MGRNKMEQEFSDKLNQREIQPSAAAWDRLDAMLTASEAQPKVVKIKKSYKWLYVAASFLGFLLVGSLFFKQDAGKQTVIPTQNQVVENGKSDASDANANESTVVVSDTQMADVSTETESAEAKTQKPEFVRKVNKITQDKKRQLASNTIINQSNPIIDQKTDKLNQDSPIAQDASVDELLAAAKAKRESSSAGAKVNARKLLLEVDNQAEEKLTPRQRAIRALNRNYQQVKVAVENRNLDETH